MMLQTYCLRGDKVLCNLPSLFSRVDHTGYSYGSAVACLSNLKKKNFVSQVDLAYKLC